MSFRVLAAIARRPGLWITALRQAHRLSPVGWWRQRPFLPLPSGEYMKFRMITQYGDAAHQPAAVDVINYLQWCRQWDRPDRNG